LLYNSEKYSDGKNISLTIEHKGESVFFIIQDTGPGIPKNAIDKMFKPFTKINELSEGLGLGLFLCRRVVMLLNGTLTFDPSYTNGSRFVVSLPLSH
jgi:signal transduction histidine kinase